MIQGDLTIKEKLRNKRISKKQVIGERPFAVIKRVLNENRTFVKRLSCVKIIEMFKCFAYGLYQLVTLDLKKLVMTI